MCNIYLLCASVLYLLQKWAVFYWIWENPPYGIFLDIKFDVWLISFTIELTRVQVFRPIVCFVVEMQRFVCDRATPPIIEKLCFKGVVMHAYGVSAYYA